MAEPLNLSQSAWSLFDVVQQQLHVSIEVFDSAMRPLAGAAAADTLGTLESPLIAAEAQRSLRTGDVRVDRSSGMPVGIFPLRVARQVAGCLVVSPRRRLDGHPEPSGEANVEAAGHLARMAVESDLTLTAQLGESRYRTRRLHGVLRFLVQLGADTDETAMMNAVVQAASVWYDADCRIYQRQSDGSYELAASLPSAEPRASAVKLDATRAEKLVAARRLVSPGDIEDLGVGGRRGEMLVLPVGAPVPEWLVLLSGAIDQEAELTFGAMARVIGGELLTRAVARVDAWHQRLAAIADDTRRAPERILMRLLEALASQAGATAARVTLINGAAERVLAAVGQPAEPAAGPAAPPTGFTEVMETIAVEPGARVRVSLVVRDDARRQASARLASWIKALRPWLREVAAALAAPSLPFEEAAGISAFERRIQEEVERAKRFNLGLGLVLIRADVGPAGDPALQALLETVRPDLRASDLLGRVRTGLAAVVLVHSEAAGADVVFNRVRQRLATLAARAPVSVVQLGKAMFSAESASADALIARALRDAQSVVLRN